MYYKEKIKDLREAKDIKEKDVAKILGLKENAYTQYENEYYIIPIKYLNELSNYLNVSLDYIFGFTNIKNYEKNRLVINKNKMCERLKELREKYSLTQKKLAESINAGKSTISEYERKSRIISTPFLYDICKKYNISADYLLGKTDSPKYLK